MKNSYSYLLVAGLFAAASGSVSAQTWDGDTSTDFATGANWDSGNAPAGNGVWTINNVSAGTAFAPILTTAITLDPDGGGGDAYVGRGGGTGTLDINSGGTLNGSGNWLFIGVDAGSTGTVNVNSGGTITSNAQLRLGGGTGTGNLNVDGGTVNVEAMDDGGGTVNINITNSGSVVATNGNIRMPNGGGSMDSGTFSASGQIFVGGRVGTSTFDLSGGTLSTGSWLAIGIGDDNNGTLNVSGGTVNTSQNEGATTIGANSNSIGAVNMTGGIWTSGNQGIILGEGGNGTGSFTLDDGDLTTTRMRVAQGATNTGTLNLNGGTFSTGSVEIGLGTATVNLNGTPITANADSVTFFKGGEANLAATTTFDTAGFNVSGDTIFGGTGGIIKNGAGTMSLTSAFHSFTGPVTVNAGGFIMGATDFFETPFGSPIEVADGAQFGVRTEFADDVIAPSDLAFQGTATTLTIDYNDPEFNIPETPIQVVGGNLSLSGTITLNIAGTNMPSGTYVLIDYSGATKMGSATWTLGTLPTGITAPAGIVDTGSTIEVNLVAPAPLWIGNMSGDWDTTTVNWEDQGTGDPLLFASGNVATFDDTADVFNVATTEDVTPSLAKFINDIQPYSLTAAGGVITGGGGLSKSMLGDLTITGMANTYTGVTTLAGGTVHIDSLTDGGVASALGAASNDAANLVLGGGSLHYMGATTSIDRGITIAGNDSGIITDNNLTLSGAIATTGGNLTKTGAGTVTYTDAGPSTIGATSPGLRVNEATWEFNGGGTQEVTVGGELWVGAVPGVDATLNVTSTTLNVGGFLGVSRGNGDTGATATVNITNSTMTVGNVGTGFDTGLPNDTNTIINLDNSTLNSGLFQVSEDENADATITLTNGSVINTDRLIMAYADNSQVDIVINDTSGINLGNSWFALGAAYDADTTSASASITLNDSSFLTDPAGDFNIGDVTGATGILDINDSAMVSAGTGTAFIGKSTGTKGTIDLSGGSFTSDGIISLGTANGATGQITVTGGVFTQNDAADRLIVGDEGNGTLDVSGSGLLMVNGTAGLVIGEDPTGVGVVNLNTGGTITSNLVTSGGGSGTLSFNGGTLLAKSTNANFLNVTNTVIGASGGTIDNAAFDITIASSVSGSGDWTTSGTGITTLSASNGNSGKLTITGGITRTTSTTTLSKFSTVDVLTGALLNLNFTGTQFVSEFYVNGVAQGTGIYSAANRPGILAGTGILEVAAPGTYESWIASFFPGEADVNIIGPDADPDMDGQSNSLEFALGGSPNSGSDNAKVYSFSADSDADGDALPELIMTIAVRSGTPAFTGTPSPTANQDGFTYTIEGTLDLSDFTSAVSVVPTPIVTDLPVLSADYEYRSFSLDASNGLPDAGFLRANITP